MKIIATIKTGNLTGYKLVVKNLSKLQNKKLVQQYPGEELYEALINDCQHIANRMSCCIELDSNFLKTIQKQTLEKLNYVKLGRYLTYGAFTQMQTYDLIKFQDPEKNKSHPIGQYL